MTRIFNGRAINPVSKVARPLIVVATEARAIWVGFRVIAMLIGRSLSMPDIGNIIDEIYFTIII